MLLAHRSVPPSNMRPQRTLRPVALALPLVVVLCGPSLAQLSCALDVIAYDPFGNRLDFRVTRVSPEGNDKINLLSLTHGTLRVTSTKGRVTFSDRSALGRVVRITASNSRGDSWSNKVVLMQCPQRTSVRVGESDTIGLVTYTTLSGRATGCEFMGDWWVRAMPMFGISTDSEVFEGYIQKDGTFQLSGPMRGERHIVVLGRDKQPVEAVGVDVTVGKVDNIGVVDLTGSCPK